MFCLVVTDDSMAVMCVSCAITYRLFDSDTQREMWLACCIPSMPVEDMGFACAETSPREICHKLSAEDAMPEDCKPPVALKEENSGKGKGVTAEDARPPTGLKVKKRCNLGSKRSGPAASRPPPLTIPNRGDRGAEVGSTDLEASIISASGCAL